MQTNIENKVGSIEVEEVLGDDLTVVNAARVSMDKYKNKLDESDIKLLSYLAKNNHITPFFHPQIRLRIRMPICLYRQWQRSTIGFARNEVSRRYVSSEPCAFLPSQIRTAPTNGVKQGSGDIHSESCDLYRYMETTISHALFSYKRLISIGVAPEQARMILPQSTFTEVIETGSLYAYARLYNLRSEKHAQKEIQDLAAMLDPIMNEYFPHSWRLLTRRESSNS